MALYVLLVKESEDDQSVVYLFGPNEDQLGRLRINKNNGAVEELTPVPTDNAKKFFMPAAVKIRQHWRNNLFPDKTSHAS
jgi:hypothetical protein